MRKYSWKKQESLVHAKITSGFIEFLLQMTPAGKAKKMPINIPLTDVFHQWTLISSTKFEGCRTWLTPKKGWFRKHFVC